MSDGLLCERVLFVLRLECSERDFLECLGCDFPRFDFLDLERLLFFFFFERSTLLERRESADGVECLRFLDVPLLCVLERLGVLDLDLRDLERLGVLERDFLRERERDFLWERDLRRAYLSSLRHSSSVLSAR